MAAVHPARTSPRLCVLEKSAAAEHLHDSLEPIFSNTAAFELELPGLLDIEAVLDKQSLCLPLSDSESLSFARVSVKEPGAGPSGSVNSRLLDRSNLSAVFGLESWHFNEHWNVKMPCTPMINCITGIPVTKENPEAVLCGHPRWCRSCSEYYESSPHLVQELVQRLVKDTFFSDSVVRPGVTAEGFPVHVCSSPCNGVVG